MRIHVAESSIPSDLTTPTLGSNYGLDGFEDMQYGMGVLEGVLDPDLLPSPALPTGLSKGAADQLDLDGVIAETPLNDLTWLSGFEPDPERLPNNPRTLDSKPDLQRLWGGNRAHTQRSAHEVDLAVLRDRGELTNVRSATPTKRAEVVRKASRRVHAKAASDDIAREAALALGGDDGAVRAIVDAVERDRGLAGSVFVRYASFPGYASGKWKGWLNQHAKSARYLLVDEQTIKNAAWIQDGRCTYTGKIAVTSIPWDEAYRHYAPRLKAAGYAVPQKSSDPRRALQAMFLAGPQTKAIASNVPSHAGDIQKLGKSSFDPTAAVQAFEESRVRSLNERVAQVKARVARGEKGAVLLKRVASMFSPAEAPEAVKLLAPVLKSALQDDPRQVRMAENMAGLVEDIRDLNAAKGVDGEAVVGALEGRREASVQAKVAHIKARIEKGEHGAILRKRIASTFGPDELRLAHKLLAPVLRGVLLDRTPEVRMATETVGKVDDIRVVNRGKQIDPVEIATVVENRRMAAIESKVDTIKSRIAAGERGEILRRRIATTFAPSEQADAARLLANTVTPEILRDSRKARVAKDSGERVIALSKTASESSLHQKIAGAVGWVRRAMNEGFAGKNLDDAIHHRFTETLLKEAAENIAHVRAAHEGLAGFRYVDAAVYASKSGVAGCESGGTKHRANQVKMVLAMDRCGSCAMANALPNGMKRCSVYNKVLVRAADLNGPEIRKAKAEAIRLANANDAEHTASLFAPRFNPQEFGLHNPILDNIRPEDLPENDKVNDIVMGGLIF